MEAIKKIINENYELDNNLEWQLVEESNLVNSWIGFADEKVKYLFKQYLTDSRIETKIQNFEKIKSKLNELISLPILTKDGNKICSFKEDKFLLLELPEGQFIDSFEEGLIPEIARTLAKVHCGLFSIKDEIKDIDEEIKLSNPNFIDISSNIPSDQCETQKEFNQRVQKEVNAFLVSSENKNFLRFPIHTNLMTSNLIFDTGKIENIINWDELRFDTPLYDLALITDFIELEQDDFDLAEKFSQLYFIALKELNPELFEKILADMKYLEDVKLVLWYNELCFTLKNDSTNEEYIELIYCLLRELVGDVEEN